MKRPTDEEFEAAVRAPRPSATDAYAHMLAVQAYTLIYARQAREDVKWLVEQLRRMLCENSACRPCCEDRARLTEMAP
jgi:hypothetical protein